MFFTLILENANGDQVDMTATANRYMTSRVEGLNPPPGTISTSSYAGMDGSYLNNAFIEKRNVVISFEMRGVGMEARRHQLYKVVKPSRYIKVYYKTAGIDVFTEGYVETCEVNNFEMLTTGQISILCPDIYWYSTESVMAYYSQITGAFTFPFPTESNPEPFVLGKYNSKNMMEIKVSEDFEDFLAKCADFGILVDYNPDHKIDLKFMLAEQKERNPRAKFTRAKTLGYFYESQQIRRRIESYKYQMSHRPTARIIRTTAERFQQSQGLQNWADRENMKVVSKALNEMNASNSTLEELESAAHKALAKFTVMSTPQMTMSRRIHELEEQIPAIEKYHEFVEYHKKYTSLEGKEKTKYKSDFCHELDEYNKAYKKLIELFPDGHIPKLSKLKTELENTRKEYAELSAERTAYKKEADRLSRLAQQKRDSQRTVKRYLQNEQAAKRKKGQLE